LNLETRKFFRPGRRHFLHLSAYIPNEDFGIHIPSCLFVNAFPISDCPEHLRYDESGKREDVFFIRNKGSSVFPKFLSESSVGPFNIVAEKLFYAVVFNTIDVLGIELCDFSYGLWMQVVGRILVEVLHPNPVTIVSKCFLIADWQEVIIPFLVHCFHQLASRLARPGCAYVLDSTILGKVSFYPEFKGFIV